MFPTVCPVCKNAFYSEEERFGGDLASHNYCVQPGEQQEMKLARTSTPIAELENSPASSFSDSVTDFFYQSWKNGLHSGDKAKDQRPQMQPNHQPCGPPLGPVVLGPQVVYVNTVIYQAFTACSYVPQVGYRADGTFGVIPPNWAYQGY